MYFGVGRLRPRPAFAATVSTRDPASPSPSTRPAFDLGARTVLDVDRASLARPGDVRGSRGVLARANRTRIRFRFISSQTSRPPRDVPRRREVSPRPTDDRVPASVLVEGKGRRTAKFLSFGRLAVIGRGPDCVREFWMERRSGARKRWPTRCRTARAGGEAVKPADSGQGCEEGCGRVSTLCGFQPRCGAVDRRGGGRTAVRRPRNV